MRKIRVFHIITRFITGGAPENTLLTVEDLDKERYEVVLACGAQSELSDDFVKALNKKGIDVVLFPNLIREVSPLRDLVALLKLTSYLKRNRFDIVHTHTSKAGILGRWAAKFAGAPIIVHTTHGQIFYGYFNFLVNRLFVTLEKLTALITDKIITLTNTEISQHLLYNIGKKSQYTPIISGIDIGEFKNLKIDFGNKRKELGLDIKAPLVGTIGSLAPVKGHRYLLKAANRIRKVLPDVKFVIVGEGFLEKRLKRRVRRLKLEDKIIFLGRRHDVSEILSILDLYVQPSLNEGMGRVIVQAMAAGLPVVASDVGGIPEVVVNGKTGILIPSKDSISLANMITYLLRDREAARGMGEEGKKRIDYNFSAEYMVNGISALYRELLSQKKIAFI